MAASLIVKIAKGTQIELYADQQAYDVLTVTAVHKNVATCTGLNGTEYSIKFLEEEQ